MSIEVSNAGRSGVQYGNTVQLEDLSSFSDYYSHEDALRHQFETDRNLRAFVHAPGKSLPNVMGGLIEHYGIEKPVKGPHEFAS